MKNGSLSKVRAHIHTLDQGIQDLVAKRLTLAREARSLKTQVRDLAQEEQVIQFYRDWAVNQGLDPDLAQELACCLIRWAISVQDL